jgi:hypothetical protein
MTNILKAITNIIEYKLYNLNQYEDIRNYHIRINNTGEGLENLIKDSFCENFNNENSLELYNKYFSYLGNQNNPPDLILRNSDAIEIKKIESNEGNLALNSSFPKNKLYRNSSLLTTACKNCEDNWEVKDICYVIGSIDKNKTIKSLWFIYGDCYCAEEEIYLKIKANITDNMEKLGLELSDTNEIAKIKKVDPLGITDLRVRGMWGITHPARVFEYITKRDNYPYIKAIMLKSKFNNFPKPDVEKLSQYASIKEIKIQNPNNPASLLDAVLIEYFFENTTTAKP